MFVAHNTNAYRTLSANFGPLTSSQHIRMYNLKSHAMYQLTTLIIVIGVYYFSREYTIAVAQEGFTGVMLLVFSLSRHNETPAIVLLLNDNHCVGSGTFALFTFHRPANVIMIHTSASMPSGSGNFESQRRCQFLIFQNIEVECGDFVSDGTFSPYNKGIKC